MIILGIDPGLNATGYGFIECSKNNIKCIEVGTIKPKRTELIENRLNKIYVLLDELIKKHKPSVMVLEKLYAHHTYASTASILGHVRGVICLLSAQNQVTLAEYSVKRIRKAITGNGNASKQQVQRLVSQLLNLDYRKLTLDASDALALAIGHSQMKRQK